jgi:hypothetical protein
VIELGGSTTIKVLHHDSDGYNEPIPQNESSWHKKDFHSPEGKVYDHI